MLNHKTVYFDVEKEFKTLKDLFKKYRYGHLTIILLSDIYDEEDIYVPSSLKSLYITSEREIQRKVIHSDICLYCQGVETSIEYVGTDDYVMSLVGMHVNKRELTLRIENCCMKTVIGASGVNKINELSLLIKNSQIQKLSGIKKNNKILKCKDLTINASHSDIADMNGIDYLEEMNEKASENYCDGRIYLWSCTTQNIRFWNHKKMRKECNQGHFVLYITGNSSVLNGVQ